MMDESVPVYRNPKWQAFFVVLLAAVVYIWMMGRQGTVSDVIVDGQYAYVAVGNTGGLRIVDLQSLMTPREVGFVDTPGAARKLAFDGHYVYVADGAGGLRVVDVSDKANPIEVGSATFNRDIQDVLVYNGLAYLAAGKNGLLIVSVLNPANPQQVGFVETPGIAQGLAVDTLYISDLSAQSSLITTLYVADGPMGLQVVNIANPATPAIIGAYNTAGNAHDVAVYNSYAFVADGNSGLQLVDVYNLQNLQRVGVYDTRGEALGIWYEAGWVYLAEGNRGIEIFDATNPTTNPLFLGGFDTPGTAQSLMVMNRMVYIADGANGMQLATAIEPAAASIIGDGYEAPGEASFGDVLGIVPRFLGFLQGGIQAKSIAMVKSIFFDLCLCSLGLVFGVIFFAQFVLPVRKLKDRLSVIERFVLHLLGMHGPAIFIEDGEVRQSQKDKLAYGEGVAVLDTASAAVFRNAHAFTRPAGPGVVFTRAGEFLAGQLDLHRQIKFIGPRSGENPFAPRKENPTEAEKADDDARFERRNMTTALTRDGVEVIPNILSVFKLDADYGEGGTQFGYRDRSVWQAIAHEGIRPEPVGLQDRRVSWDWLPVYMTVDLWREYLRKFTVDDLFGFSCEPPDSNTPLDPKLPLILRLVRARLTQKFVDRYDEMGRPVYKLDALGHPTQEIEQIQSPQFDQLQERGIRVIAANIRDLRFPAAVEKNLVEQWKANWLERARDELRDSGRMQTEKQIEGERDAIMRFAEGASQPVYDRLFASKNGLSNNNLALSEIIELLTRGTLDSCLRDPDLRGRLSNEKSSLSALIDWIRK